jgi:peptide chain release factor 1
MEIDLKDIKIEYFKGSGPGGQRRNKVETAVRAIHVPSGIKAECQDSRSQAQNKASALAELYRRLNLRIAEVRRDKLRAMFPQETLTIKTYNFQRGTVKDHRTGRVKSLSEVLNGRI